MPSKYKRTLAGCWDREQIERAIATRQAELNGNEPKTETRIRYLKKKIAKLRKALETGAPVGGNILKQPKNKLASKRRKDHNSSEAPRKHKRVKKTCFKCRKRGHTIQECQGEEGGICFRCGSKDHILKNCKEKDTGTLPYSTCFVCHKVGHIASQCEDNEKGIYPKGGACFFCGSVKHRKIDCPERGKKSNRKSDVAEVVGNTDRN